MTELLLFTLGTAVLAWLSRHALRKPLSHGFYRFFAWVCILALVFVNFPMWERDPLAPRQLVSWTLLALSFALALHAVRLLRQVGRPDDRRRQDAELYAFERTSTLVTSGVFRYIRHPMYAALLYLAWGAFLKDVSAASVALVTGASAALLMTALRDEAECLEYFGGDYAAYMKTSKRFVPFVF
jgi:protein-S-isoprenylcysteine O-methyltransferase Ste14